MSKLGSSKKIESSHEHPTTERLSRRETAKKLVKMAYVAPAVLAIVKTSERPAFGGVPSPPPTQP